MPAPQSTANQITTAVHIPICVASESVNAPFQLLRHAVPMPAVIMSRSVATLTGFVSTKPAGVVMMAELPIVLPTVAAG